MPPPLNLLEDSYFLLSQLPFSACAKAAGLAWRLRDKVKPEDSEAAGGRDTVTKVWRCEGEGVFVKGKGVKGGRKS